LFQHVIYSPKVLTRSDILINRSDIFVNAFCSDGPYTDDVTPASVFNLLL
jgi:hypothetical protein